MSPHGITPGERLRRGQPRLRVDVPDPPAMSQMRTRLRELVGDAMPAERLSDAILAATELVSNSILHAGPGPITLWAWLDEHRLRVEVHDGGPGIPDDRDWSLPARDVIGGRGLPLVRMVTDRCGHRREPHAVAWMEMDLAPR